MAVLVGYFVNATVESQRNYYEMAGVVSLFGGVAGASRYFTKRKGENGNGFNYTGHSNVIRGTPKILCRDEFTEAREGAECLEEKQERLNISRERFIDATGKASSQD